MPRVDAQEPLLPSLLERLIDREPEVSTEPAWKRTQSLREFEQEVLKNLEALLNARQVRPDLGVDFKEASRSLLTYGLPDFSSSGAGPMLDFEGLRLAVEAAIERFEPRIRQVQVRVVPRESETDRTLRLIIEGLLWVQPDPQPITFDTIVEPYTGQCTIESR